MAACLDAWALIALLDDEPAAGEVEQLIRDGGCVMSWINVGEVRYAEARRGQADQADRAIAMLPAHVDLVDATGPRVMAAARLKSSIALSYADCFAAATAIEFGVPLATGDAGLLALDQPGLRTIDLRGTSTPGRA